MNISLKRPVLRKTKRMSKWNNGISYLLNNPSKKYTNISTSDPLYRFIVVRKNNNMFTLNVYRYKNNKWNRIYSEFYKN